MCTVYVMRVRPSRPCHVNEYDQECQPNEMNITKHNGNGRDRIEAIAYPEEMLMPKQRRKWAYRCLEGDQGALRTNLTYSLYVYLHRILFIEFRFCRYVGSLFGYLGTVTFSF